MFEPNGNSVLIKPHGQETKSSKAGIIMVEDPNFSPTEGTIISKGEMVVGTSIKVGRTAKFKQHSGEKVTISGEEYLIVDQGNIYGAWTLEK